MSKAEELPAKLQAPIIVAPLFTISGIDLVVASCKAGVIGAYPALNSRTTEDFEECLGIITKELDDFQQQNPDAKVAPYAMNLVLRNNDRLEADLQICEKYKVPIIITIMGRPKEVVDRVHAYGGMVFSDVTTIDFAKKAIEGGVDGLVLVCAGAGGHAGTLSHFAFVPAVREFFDGVIIVGGALSSGGAVRAAEALGGDLAYMGTRFIPTVECQAQEEYKQMIVDSTIHDIIYTPAVSGIPANFMKDSLVKTGFDISDPANVQRVDDSGAAKPWSGIWGAGQGVHIVHEISTVSDLVKKLKDEYDAA